MSTKIEWVKNSDGTQGDTWNPITGCTRVSTGCTHCFAERMAARLQAMGKPGYQGTVDKNGRWTGQINFIESALEIPLKRKKPTVYFANSMSDLFHADVEFDWLDSIWSVMARCPQHTFQILTKRASLLSDRVQAMVDIYGILPNVWLGVSVENQAAADERIPYLLQAPAAIRFLSCEPLLGPLDLEDLAFEKAGPDWAGYNPLVDWIICGGESGPHARPMHPQWPRNLRDQCLASGVPFFFKQWGNLLPGELDPNEPDKMFPWRNWQDGSRSWLMPELGQVDLPPVAYRNVGKKEAGHLLDGREWSQFPQTGNGPAGAEA